MAILRNNSNIIKGSALMLFFGDNEKPVGFATEHSIEINLETVDIQTKDHGDFAAVLPQRLTWSGSASNLYSDEGEQFYMNLIKTATPLKIVFAKASNYEPAGYSAGSEGGVVGADHAEWSAGTSIAEGQCYITNFSINASAGDQATMTIQFTGSGSFAEILAPTGPTGATG